METFRNALRHRWTPALWIDGRGVITVTSGVVYGMTSRAMHRCPGTDNHGKRRDNERNYLVPRNYQFSQSRACLSRCSLSCNFYSLIKYSSPEAILIKINSVTQVRSITYPKLDHSQIKSYQGSTRRWYSCLKLSLTTVCSTCIMFRHRSLFTISWRRAAKNNRLTTTSASQKSFSELLQWELVCTCHKFTRLCPFHANIDHILIAIRRGV